MTSSWKRHTYTRTSWNWATSVDLLYSLLWLTVLYKHVICCYELEEQICIPSSHIIVYICHGRSVILIVCTQTLRDIVLVYRSVCSKLERKFCCINPDTGLVNRKPNNLAQQFLSVGIWTVICNAGRYICTV